MSRARPVPLPLQLLLWAAVSSVAGAALALAISLFQGDGFGWPVFAVSVLLANVVGLSVMLASFLLFPRIRGLHPLLGVALIVLTIAGATATGTLLVVSQFFLFVVSDFRLTLGISAITVTTGLLVGGIVYVYEGLRHRLADSLREVEQVRLAQAELREQAARAQLAALQARINPHFFFNTLNTISSLLEEDPRRAQEMIERLAGLFRYTFRAAEAGAVTLSEEARFIGDYLEIERARFGDRLRVEWELEEETLNTALPGLILQPLVENAVGHGIAPRAGGGTVRIRSRRRDGCLRIEVADDGPGLADAARPWIREGHGLGNVAQRLRALYGDSGTLQLETEEAGRGTRAVLAIREE